MWRRLQGLSFSTNHLNTPEIQSATIRWSYNDTSEETANIQIWDVVDHGDVIVNENNSMLLSTTTRLNEVDKTHYHQQNISSGSHRLGVFDAESVDVYSNTNAVIFLVNPYDITSLDYVKQLCLVEPQKIPNTVAILIVLNFRDLVNPIANSNVSSNSSNDNKGNISVSPDNVESNRIQKHVVSYQDIKDLVEDIRKAKHDQLTVKKHHHAHQSDKYDIDEESNTTDGIGISTFVDSQIAIHCLEASMSNCFGLKNLHQVCS